MSVYTIEVSPDDFESLSEIGSRELTLWRGVKNKSLRSRFITDGTMLIDKKHVTDDGQELFDKLCDRKSDENVDNEEIKNLISQLKSEDQVEVEVDGQIKNPPGMGELKAKWIAFVNNNGSRLVASAMRIDMVNRLIGESADLKVGDSGILTWWKYGVPVASVATWNFFDINVKESE